MLLNQRYEYNHTTDLLGVGGFGRVYKAKDTLLNRQVALKIVSIEGHALQYNLINEVQKSIDLSHGNIVRFYDAFVLKEETLTGDRETQVGVMEYIPHGDISQLDWNNLSQEQQKDILLQILDGLGYLHRNRIIHRDIKPSNILIKKEGERIIPKITDFGISKSQDAASVSVSRVIGSIPYMAPEQFDSKGRVSYNTDFWSLGILVYRLFTGTLPFGDESTTSEGVIMKNIMEAPMPEEVQQIPLPFRTLVELCLVKDRAERVKETAMLVDVLNDVHGKYQPKPADTVSPASGTKTDETIKTQAEETTKVHIRQPVAAQSDESLEAKPTEQKGKPSGRETTSALSQNSKSDKKNIYWLMGLAALFLILVILGVQHFSDGKQELAETEAADLIASETGQDTTQLQETAIDAAALEEEQRRMAASREELEHLEAEQLRMEQQQEQKQQEQARLAAEREAEEQRQREEEARLEAERLAEEQRQREEQAHIEAERQAEEQRQREEQARIEAERQVEKQRQNEKQPRSEAELRDEAERQRLIREWEAKHGTKVIEVTNPATGRTWMDRNLGASRAATFSRDERAYGDLYQWGRGPDGHQKRDSPKTNRRSRSDQPGHGNFIIVPSRVFIQREHPCWRIPQNLNLWQGVNGINNPCPPGFRLPTIDEWKEERQSWTFDGASGAIASPLKLPLTGQRSIQDGLISSVDFGVYWSSNTGNRAARHFSFSARSALISFSNRAFGAAVRCIKD